MLLLAVMVVLQQVVLVAQEVMHTSPLAFLLTVVQVVTVDLMVLLVAQVLLVLLLEGLVEVLLDTSLLVMAM
jgi:hypothetical protein